MFGETLAETFAWNPEAIGRLRPRARIRSAHEAIAWAGHAEFAPGAPADFGNVLFAIGRGRIEPAVLRRLPDRPDALAAGVSALPAEMFTQLAGLWGPGTRPRPAAWTVADALEREVAWRFLSDTEAPAAAVVTAFGVRPSTWIEQLARYQSEFGTAAMAPAFRQVAALRVRGLNAGLGQILTVAPPDELLALADKCAVDLPELSKRLLGVVARRHPMPEGERLACHSQLELRTFMVGTVERCFPNDPASESEALRQLLSVIVAPGLHRPEDFEGLLSRIIDIRSAPLLRALAESVSLGMRQRVLAAAGNVWFQDNGLPPLAVGAAPPAEQAALVSARSAQSARSGGPGRSRAGCDAQAGEAVRPPQETPGGSGRTRWWLLVTGATVAGVAVGLVLYLLLGSSLMTGSATRTAPDAPRQDQAAETRLKSIAAELTTYVPLTSRRSGSTLAVLARDLDTNARALIGTNLVSAFPPQVLLPDATSQNDRWVHRLELVRDVLVFVPVLLTWWQLRSALEAYNRSVAQAERQHTTAISFLLGWQRGFDHQVWPLSTSALLVALIIALVICSTLAAHFWNARIDSANSRTRERAHLADLLAEGTLLLTQVRSPRGTFTRADIERMVHGFYENSDRLSAALRESGEQISDSLQSGPASVLGKALNEWSAAAAALRELGQSLTVPTSVLNQLSELERELAASSVRLSSDVEGLVGQLGEHTEAAGREAVAHMQMARNVSDASDEVHRALDTLSLRLETLGGLVDELRLAVEQARGPGPDDPDDWTS